MQQDRFAIRSSAYTFSSSIIYIRVASTTAGSIFRVMLSVLAGNQYHAHGLRTSAPFCRLRLWLSGRLPTAISAPVSPSNRPTLRIRHPPQFQGCTLSNNPGCWFLRVDIQHIQRCSTLYSATMPRSALRAGCGGGTHATVAHRHMGNFSTGTPRRGGACQFAAPSPSAGYKFCAHGLLSI